MFMKPKSSSSRHMSNSFPGAFSHNIDNNMGLPENEVPQNIDDLYITFPDAPWCGNIYLQNWVMFEVKVGTYSSTMEHLGYHNWWVMFDV